MKLSKKYTSFVETLVTIVQMHNFESKRGFFSKFFLTYDRPDIAPHAHGQKVRFFIFYKCLVKKTSEGSFMFRNNICKNKSHLRLVQH